MHLQTDYSCKLITQAWLRRDLTWGCQEEREEKPDSLGDYAERTLSRHRNAKQVFHKRVVSSFIVARASCAWFTGETPVTLFQTDPLPIKGVRTFRIAAASLSRSKTALGAFYHRIRVRVGPAD